MTSRRTSVATASLMAMLALLSSSCAGSSDAVTDATSTTAAVSTEPSTTTTSPAGPAVSPDDLAMPLGAIVVKPAVAPAATTVDGKVQTPDGRSRTYHLYVPDAVAGSGVARVPLLVALHGGTGWGTQFEKNSGFDGLAEANQFIVVYPDGVGVGSTGTELRTWNGGRCCGPATKQDVDDVSFIRLLIDRLESQYDIDPARVFAAGHSNGGIMAYRLACELGDRIVAIGVQSSALEVSSCDPARPVSVLHIHGSADQNLPIDGGLGPKAISGVSFSRPIDGVHTLAEADDCPARPTDAVGPVNPDLTTSSWSPCRGDTEVAFVEVAGAAHPWMGHAAASGRSGTPYPDLDSSLVIWNFLSQHPRT